MPTYEYQCKACGHTLEEFHSITEPPLTRCPKCDTDNLARVMGTGVGLIFRGTGFYLTDYKKSGSSASSSPGSTQARENSEGKSSEEKAAKKPSGGSAGSGDGTGGKSASSGDPTPPAR